MTIWLPFLRHGATLTALTLLADVGARIFWQWLPPPALSSPSTISLNPDHYQTTSQLQAADFYDLFGRPPMEQTAPVVVAQTALDAKLVGIIYSPDSTQSRAFIAVQNTPEALFRVGETLIPGVTVANIQVRRVLLSRNDQLEVFELPNETLDATASESVAYFNANDPNFVREGDHGGTPSGDDPPPRQLPPQVDATEFATRIRTTFQQNPSPDALREFAVINPITESGQFRGFRVFPGRDRRALFRLGLQTGDVITAVNGQPLTSSFQAEMLIRSLLTDNQIQLAISRQGQDQQATFILSQ